MNKLYLVLTVIILTLIGTSCINNTQNQKNKMEKQHDTSESIEKLLDELNYWQKQGGDSSHPIDSIISTGESNSKFLDLKEKILSSGYLLQWEPGKYSIKKE